jgi:hypothetical protein
MGKARGDHFVKVDFIGWKYFELVEIESTRFHDYIWEDLTTNELDPFTHHVYSSHRTRVQFTSVDKLQIWYNNLPANKEVNCIIGQIKALPIIPNTISNPSVTIEGKRIEFPVTMESGMYLELKSESDCKLYSPEGKLLQELPIKVKIPELKSGNNEISFSCEKNNKVSARVKVTIINEGDPL